MGFLTDLVLGEGTNRQEIALKVLLHDVKKRKPIRKDNRVMELTELRERFVTRINRLDVDSILKDLALDTIEKLAEENENVLYFVLIATEALKDDQMETSLKSQSLKMNKIRVPFNKPSKLHPVIRLPDGCNTEKVVLPWDISPVLTEYLLDVTDVSPPPPIDVHSREPNNLLSLPFLRLLKSETIRRSGKNIPIPTFTEDEVKHRLARLYCAFSSDLFTKDTENEEYFLPHLFDVCDSTGYNILESVPPLLQEHLLLGNEYAHLLKKISEVDVNDCVDIVRSSLITEFQIFGQEITEEATSNDADIFQFLKKTLQSASWFVSTMKTFYNIITMYSTAIELSSAITEMSRIAFRQDTKTICDRILERINKFIVKAVLIFLKTGNFNSRHCVFQLSSNNGLESQVSMKHTNLVPENLCLKILQSGSIIRAVQSYKKRSSDSIQLKQIREEIHMTGVRDDLFFQENIHLRLDIHGLLTKLFNSCRQSNVVLLLKAEAIEAFDLIRNICLKINAEFPTNPALVPLWLQKNKIGTKNNTIFCSNEDGKLHVNFVLSDMAALTYSIKHCDFYLSLRSHLELLHVTYVRLLKPIDGCCSSGLTNKELRRGLYQKTYMLKVVSNFLNHTSMTIDMAVNIFTITLENANTFEKIQSSHKDCIRSIDAKTLYGILRRRPGNFIQRVCSPCDAFCSAFENEDFRSMESHFATFEDNINCVFSILESNEDSGKKLLSMLK